ncbi:hypothetical protein [Rheinheimera fenheensis]|uniref:hypothetical protein n=1 Tax=Rheinheimera fenheensis TaxID=3152295 RepID=UPI00326136DF
MTAAVSYLCAALMVAPVYAMQDLAQEAPMLSQPYFGQNSAPAAEKTYVAVADFSQQYSKAKQPAVMVLFGRTLNDVVSDWQSDVKLNVSSEVKNTAQSTSPNAVSTDVSLQTREPASRQKSALLSASQWAELERGFLQATLAYRVKLVNQNLAVRLLDAERRESKDKLATTDAQQLEIDVLRKHSPLLIEIMPYQEADVRKEYIGFEVSFSSLADASLVAQQRIALNLAPAQWQAGTNGYELKPVSSSKQYVAAEGGYQVVNAPDEYWYQQGQQLGTEFVQMFYDSWLTATAK